MNFSASSFFLYSPAYEEKAMIFKKNSEPEGINLLASILICYREISAIAYEPKDKTVKLTFVIEKNIGEKDFQELAEFLAESMNTYLMVSGFYGTRTDFNMETQGKHAFLHITRELETLTKGELTLIVTLLEDRFGEALIMGGDNAPDDEMLEIQEETLERMLMSTRMIELRGRLVGVREGDAVMVYNK